MKKRYFVLLTMLFVWLFSMSAFAATNEEIVAYANQIVAQQVAAIQASGQVINEQQLKTIQNNALIVAQQQLGGAPAPAAPATVSNGQNVATQIGVYMKQYRDVFMAGCTGGYIDEISSSLSGAYVQYLQPAISLCGTNPKWNSVAKDLATVGLFTPSSSDIYSFKTEMSILNYQYGFAAVDYYATCMDYGYTPYTVMNE